MGECTDSNGFDHQLSVSSKVFSYMTGLMNPVSEAIVGQWTVESDVGSVTQFLKSLTQYLNETDTCFYPRPTGLTRRHDGKPSAPTPQSYLLLLLSLGTVSKHTIQQCLKYFPKISLYRGSCQREHFDGSAVPGWGAHLPSCPEE